MSDRGTRIALRVLLFVAFAAALVLLVVLFAVWILELGMLAAAFRWSTRKAGWRTGRRRRPRASFAKNLEAVSLAYAAWNTRHLAGVQGTLRGDLRRRIRESRKTNRIDPDSEEIPF